MASKADRKLTAPNDLKRSDWRMPLQINDPEVKLALIGVAEFGEESSTVATPRHQCSGTIGIRMSSLHTGTGMLLQRRNFPPSARSGHAQLRQAGISDMVTRGYQGL